MSEHTPTYLNTAGITMCEQCSDDAGRVIRWLDVHPDDVERHHLGGTVRIER